MKILEKHVLKDCKDFLARCQNRKLLVFNRIHCMPIMRGNGRFTLNNDMRGMEDIQVFLKEGFTLHVECKSPEGKLTSEQMERRRILEAIGHVYLVVRDVSELIEALSVYEPRTMDLLPKSGLEIREKEDAPKPKPLKPAIARLVVSK